jgi:hypothetical protein
MAKSDQDEIRRALQQARREPLPSYTEEEEKSINRSVERLDYYEKRGSAHANLVVNTLTKTLNGLPDKDRIKFLYAVIVLLLAMLGAFVVLKVKGVW